MAKRWDDPEIGIDIAPWERGERKKKCPRCQHTRSRIHQSDRPLSVNVEQGIWSCHHCDWKGSLGYEHTDWRSRLDIRTYVAPPPVPEEATLDERALAFFAARGISPETVARFGVFTTREYDIEAEREMPAIAFPYYRVDADTGERIHINTKYRFPEKHFKMAKGAELIFYNLDRTTEATDLIIVEGEPDTLAMAEAGYGHETISVPNGGNTTSMPFLDDPTFREALDRVTTVILAVDMDETGRTLEQNLARMLGEQAQRKMKRVTWPEGCKDANDVLREHGVGGIKTALAEATYYPIGGSVHVRDLMRDLRTTYQYGATRGFYTGWQSLDPFYTVRPGELTVVTGIPSHGKSEWTNSLLINMIREHGHAFSIFSPENYDDTPAPMLEQLIRKWVKKPFKQAYSDRMTWEEAEDAGAIIDEHIAFINPEEPTLDAIFATADLHLTRLGIKGLVIDPWNEITHERKGLTETDYIGEALRKVRTFARQRQIHVWIVAHPTKMQKVQHPDGVYRFEVPNPYSISGSQHWYNKPDNCITIYRADDITQIHIQKIRKQPDVGKKGVVEMMYEWRSASYQELSARESVAA